MSEHQVVVDLLERSGVVSAGVCAPEAFVSSGAVSARSRLRSEMCRRRSQRPAGARRGPSAAADGTPAPRSLRQALSRRFCLILLDCFGDATGFASAVADGPERAGLGRQRCCRRRPEPVARGAERCSQLDRDASVSLLMRVAVVDAASFVGADFVLLAAVHPSERTWLAAQSELVEAAESQACATATTSGCATRVDGAGQDAQARETASPQRRPSPVTVLGVSSNSGEAILPSGLRRAGRPSSSSSSSGSPGRGVDAWPHSKAVALEERRSISRGCRDSKRSNGRWARLARLHARCSR